MAAAHDLALSGFPYDAALGPLGDLQALVLGELVEDTVGEFALGRVVPLSFRARIWAPCSANSRLRK
jgi:hypothetical protein